LRLALEPDADALRRRLGTAQAKIAQARPGEPIPTSASGSASMFRVSCPATPTAWRKLSLRPPFRSAGSRVIGWHRSSGTTPQGKYGH